MSLGFSYDFVMWKLSLAVGLQFRHFQLCEAGIECRDEETSELLYDEFKSVRDLIE